MKAVFKCFLLFFTVAFTSCGSNEKDKNKYDDEEETIVHNYVNANELTILKNVNSSKIANYFETNSNRKVYKENISFNDDVGNTFFNEVCTDDTFYYYMYDGFQNNGRVINLKEIYYFPIAEVFVLKNQINKYENLNVGNYNYTYHYQNTAETAFRIGMKANQPGYAGTYYQEAINLSNMDAAGYLVNITFSIPVFEPPSSLPEARDVNCNWTMAKATNFTQANKSFSQDQGNLCTDSYGCLSGIFNYLNSKITSVDSGYKMFSK